MTNEEKSIFLTSAMNQYIFDSVFKQNNNGKSFNVEAWLDDVEKITSDSLFAISPEKQAQLSSLLLNLDKYAIERKNDNYHFSKDKDKTFSSKPKLELV